MVPIVDGLEEEFSGQVEVFRLDGEEPAEEQAAANLGLRGHPSFAILDADGQVSGRFFGAQPAGTLRSAMAAIQ